MIDPTPHFGPIIAGMQISFHIHVNGHKHVAPLNGD